MSDLHPVVDGFRLHNNEQQILHQSVSLTQSPHEPRGQRECWPHLFGKSKTKIKMIYFLMKHFFNDQPKWISEHMFGYVRILNFMLTWNFQIKWTPSAEQDPENRDKQKVFDLYFILMGEWAADENTMGRHDYILTWKVFP